RGRALGGGAVVVVERHPGLLEALPSRQRVAGRPLPEVTLLVGEDEQDVVALPELGSTRLAGGAHRLGAPGERRPHQGGRRHADGDAGQELAPRYGPPLRGAAVSGHLCVIHPLPPSSVMTDPSVLGSSAVAIVRTAPPACTTRGRP